MTTSTDICNLALSHVGGLRISSIEEQSETARTCRTIYPIARDQVLRDHAWGFAERRRKLSLLANLTIPGFEYAYQYPQDCLLAREIFRADQALPPILYRVMRHEDNLTKMIATNEAEAILVYTCKIEDEDQFDSSFITAFAWRIAVDLAIPITKKTAFQDIAERAYGLAIGAAARVDNLEGEEPAPDQFKSFLKARL